MFLYYTQLNCKRGRCTSSSATVEAFQVEFWIIALAHKLLPLTLLLAVNLFFFFFLPAKEPEKPTRHHSAARHQPIADEDLPIYDAVGKMFIAQPEYY